MRRRSVLAVSQLNSTSNIFKSGFLRLSTERWDVFVDEELLKETIRYNRFLALEKRVKESLARAVPGTEVYNNAKLASKIVEILIDMQGADHASEEKPRIIRWVDSSR